MTRKILNAVLSPTCLQILRELNLNVDDYTHGDSAYILYCNRY